jgi:hypothetical protein
MKKIIFYLSTILFLYTICEIVNIILFHFDKPDIYRNGLLFGKFIIFFILCFIIKKTHPFKKNIKI